LPVISLADIGGVERQTALRALPTSAVERREALRLGGGLRTPAT
jgi:hypothetical protein